AWEARGRGPDTEVTKNGWKLYRERLAKAFEIVHQRLALQQCPEWFYAMQLVADGQAWNRDRVSELVRRAIQFEPGYDGDYRAHYAFLLPKAHGRAGDSEQFAERSTLERGAADGDILYFQVAQDLVCICDNPGFLRLSWPRIQSGFDELGKKYG